MKVKLLIIIIYISFTNLLFAQMKNNIVLKVENEIITNYEIKNKILTTLILANQEINQKNINNLKERALDNIINYKLKKIELSKHSYKNDTVQLNSYLANISSNDITGLKNKFIKNKINYEVFVEELQIEFKWQKLIYNTYSKKIKLNNEVINAELEKIIKNRSDIIDFELAEIEIKLDNKDTDQEKIKKIKEEIKKNGFEITALNYSFSNTSANKGYIGWVNSKSLSSEIFEMVEKIKIGETTEAIRKQNTAIFINLINKKTSRSSDVNKEELKKKLIDQKKNELFNLYARSHLSKIKNSAFIEYR